MMFYFLLLSISIFVDISRGQRIPGHRCDTLVSDSDALLETVRKLQNEVLTNREISFRNSQDLAEKEREIRVLTARLTAVETSVIHGKMPRDTSIYNIYFNTTNVRTIFPLPTH